MAEGIDLSPGQIYSLITHKQNGVFDSYQVEKKYVDCAKLMKERDMGEIKKGQKDRRHVTKRGNFLEDEQKLHKLIPGPGQYAYTLDWPEKSKLKIHYPDKLTYVDEIMKSEKKEKKPAPGQYNVEKTLKQLQAEKKKMAQKKIIFKDRISYLDEIQFESNLIPGAGSYNPRQRVQTEGSKIKTTPEIWRKKHEQEQKKKPEKSPDMRTYNPLPSDYNLFQGMPKPKTNKYLLGKVQRFKTAPSGSGMNPGKYNVIQEWKGKDSKNVPRHGLEVLSTKKTCRSVYYH